ncbi:hypothetical protein [Filimonas effusa]|uniref:NlpC/P60 domain-containing protein n=1 Tax=Filimonas effusa TaxID=2508721 RepID=A0A4Q1DC11_9BACT|nr:hypothetical protein [Filimonas effusa]RXK86870.1 hypothetical protein ESB13_08785 [Filimonas effusa]
MSNFELAQCNIFEEDYPAAVFKGQPTAIYNCHGMTFASKRTGIYEEAELLKILIDDNYVEIRELKDVLPGDIVLYYEDNKITHSGTVCRIEESVANYDLRHIFVISKWSKHKEVVHNVNYSPYSSGLKRYWRINHGFKII